MEVFAHVKDARFPHPDETFNAGKDGEEMARDSFNCEFLVTEYAPTRNYWTAVFDQEPSRDSSIYKPLPVNVCVAFRDFKDQLARQILGLKY
jgi:hypothetical protein